MTTPDLLTIHTDGAARGNPGPAAFSYVIARDGAPVIEEAACLGSMTCNQAEYTALIRALEHATRLGNRHSLAIHSDSELMVKQMRGEYRVKNPELQELYREAVELVQGFPKVTFTHVKREFNKRADELCNVALDGQANGRPKSASPSTRPHSPPASHASGNAEAAREEAIVCLQAAADAWARGDRTLRADHIWEQLWSILEENGVIKKEAGAKGQRSGRRS